MSLRLSRQNLSSENTDERIRSRSRSKECIKAQNYLTTLSSTIHSPRLSAPLKRNSALELLEPSKKTLVLDFDGIMLLKSSTKQLYPSDGEYETHHIQERPGLAEFLRILQNSYQIVIYSTESTEFIQKVVNELNLQDSVSAIYCRSHCQKTKNNEYKKNITEINDDPKNIVFVDHTYSHIQNNFENGLCIKSFKGDRDDTTLENLVPFLLDLAQKDDVRPVCKNYSDFVSSSSYQPAFLDDSCIRDEDSCEELPSPYLTSRSANIQSTTSSKKISWLSENKGRLPINSTYTGTFKYNDSDSSVETTKKRSNSTEDFPEMEVGIKKINSDTARPSKLSVFGRVSAFGTKTVL